MTTADAIFLANQRAKQLGWEKFGTEIKQYSVPFYPLQPKKTLSTGYDEFYILLSHDADPLYSFGKFGYIQSETGWYAGNEALEGATPKITFPVNFIFEGNVKIFSLSEGYHFVKLLRVYKRKP